MLSRTLVRRARLPLVALLLAAGATACGSDGDPAAGSVECEYPAGPEAARDVEAPPATADLPDNLSATVSTSIGDLAIDLDTDGAPCTVNSFVSLADQGYFDDSDCHRLTTGSIFVLQCGDPTGNGAGGPGYTLPDELDGDETYPAGTLAMANRGVPNSGGSQFFMVYDATPLPPQYTVFGQIDDAGIEALLEVAEAGVQGRGTDGRPATEVMITSVDVAS